MNRRKPERAIALFPHQSPSLLDSYFTVDLRTLGLSDLSNPSRTVRVALAVWPAPSIVLSMVKISEPSLFHFSASLPVIGRDMWMLFACPDPRRNLHRQIGDLDFLE